MARDAGLDLVLVSPDAKPPVAKILDFGQLKYLESKKDSGNKTPRDKEVKMSPNIGQHDLGTKLRHIREFLEKGHKVMVAIEFKGRQMAHQDDGKGLMEQILTALADLGNPDSPPKMNGKRFGCVISPSKKSA